MPFGDPDWNLPKTPSNPRLLRALSNLSPDDVGKRQLYDALLNSTLFIPTEAVVSTPPENRVETKVEINGEIRRDIRGKISGQVQIASVPGRLGSGPFLLVEDEQGHNTLPVFTDIQALRRWTISSADKSAENDYVTMPLQELLTNLPVEAAGIWLNLADRGSRHVSRMELSQITGGLVTTTVAEAMRREVAPPGAKLNFRVPSSLPGGVVERVRLVLSKEPDVSIGYLVLISQKGRRGRLAVGIRLTRLLDDNEIDRLLFRIRRAVNTHLGTAAGGFHTHSAPRPRRVAVHCVLIDAQTHAAISKMLPPIYEQLGDSLDLTW